MTDNVNNIKAAMIAQDAFAAKAIATGRTAKAAECSGDRAFDAYINVCDNRRRVAALWWHNADGSRNDEHHAPSAGDPLPIAPPAAPAEQGAAADDEGAAAKVAAPVEKGAAANGAVLTV